MLETLYPKGNWNTNVDDIFENKYKSGCTSNTFHHLFAKSSQNPAFTSKYCHIFPEL